MKRKWRNIPGQLTIAIYDYAPEVLTDSGKRLPALDGLATNNTDLVIDFVSSGYDDPGQMYLANGDPGYPPEREDERELVEAYLLEDGRRIDLDKDVQESVFNDLYDEICEVEIDEVGS